MPFMPTISQQSTSREMTDTFYGYNHNLKIADGEWFDTQNLTTSYYPLLAPRKKRGTVLTMTNPCGLIEKDALGYVDNGTFYYNFLATPLVGLSSGDKQIISMGAYVLIFPDQVYYNTEDPTDYGTMAADYSFTGSVTYTMCHYDGTPYQSVVVSGDEPDPTTTEIWVKTAIGSTSYSVYSYSYEASSWVELNTVYTRISFNAHGQLPALFNAMDAVEITGSSYDDINGSKIIYQVGSLNNSTDYIVVVFPMDDLQNIVASETIRIQRTIPTMDYVIEAQNRLWGCYYGYDAINDVTLNEIYCSALGDFKNWNQFLGLSTDSWVASQGTDGQWTGAVNYLGSPTFFKENHIHVVSVSSTGAHQVTETPCRGVQKGSAKSLAIVNETLYYKSRTDVCSYQGSFPNGVSDALGDITYYNATAGTFGEKYYISMEDGSGNHNLFVYDITRNLWMREDDLEVKSFAKVDDELYAIDGDNHLLALNGTTGTLEDQVEWYAETGVLYYAYPDRKYVSRFNVRLKGEVGMEIKVYIQYDSEGPWEYNGRIRQTGTYTVTLPIRPRRCDHMKIRFVGKGDCRIFSIAKILEVGSDVI